MSAFNSRKCDITENVKTVEKSHFKFSLSVYSFEKKNKADQSFSFQKNIFIEFRVLKLVSIIAM